jgi:hypothetical protein
LYITKRIENRYSEGSVKKKHCGSSE